MNWSLNLSLRKLIYFQICARLFSQVQFTERLTGKQLFTRTSEQLHEFHLLIEMFTLHTRRVCPYDYPDQHGVAVHPSLTWHPPLQRKMRCLTWDTELNNLNVNEMHSKRCLLQWFLACEWRNIFLIKFGSSVLLGIGIHEQSQSSRKYKTILTQSSIFIFFFTAAHEYKILRLRFYPRLKIRH